MKKYLKKKHFDFKEKFSSTKFKNESPLRLKTKNKLFNDKNDSKTFPKIKSKQNFLFQYY